MPFSFSLFLRLLSFFTGRTLRPLPSVLERQKKNPAGVFPTELSGFLSPELFAAFRAMIFNHDSVHAEKNLLQSLSAYGRSELFRSGCIRCHAQLHQFHHKLLPYHSYSSFRIPFCCTSSVLSSLFASDGLSNRHIKIRSRTGGWQRQYEKTGKTEKNGFASDSRG